jgi:hypothetical protein
VLARYTWQPTGNRSAPRRSANPINRPCWSCARTIRRAWFRRRFRNRRFIGRPVQQPRSHHWLQHYGGMVAGRFGRRSARAAATLRVMTANCRNSCGSSSSGARAPRRNVQSVTGFLSLFLSRWGRRIDGLTRFVSSRRTRIDGPTRFVSSRAVRNTVPGPQLRTLDCSRWFAANGPLRFHLHRRLVADL